MYPFVSWSPEVYKGEMGAMNSFDCTQTLRILYWSPLGGPTNLDWRASLHESVSLPIKEDHLLMGISVRSGNSFTLEAHHRLVEPTLHPACSQSFDCQGKV